MRTGLDKQKKCCVCVCGLAAHTFVGEGCVKIMQMRNEYEIKRKKLANYSCCEYLASFVLQKANHVLPQEGLEPVGAA